MYLSTGLCDWLPEMGRNQPFNLCVQAQCLINVCGDAVQVSYDNNAHLSVELPFTPDLCWYRPWQCHAAMILLLWVQFLGLLPARLEPHTWLPAQTYCWSVYIGYAEKQTATVARWRSASCLMFQTSQGASCWTKTQHFQETACLKFIRAILTLCFMSQSWNWSLRCFEDVIYWNYSSWFSLCFMCLKVEKLIIAMLWRCDLLKLFFIIFFESECRWKLLRGLFDKIIMSLLDTRYLQQQQ